MDETKSAASCGGSSACSIEAGDARGGGARPLRGRAPSDGIVPALPIWRAFEIDGKEVNAAQKLPACKRLVLAAKVLTIRMWILDGADKLENRLLAYISDGAGATNLQRPPLIKAFAPASAAILN